MNVPDVQLETERLILRLPRIEDFDRYAELFAHEGSHHIGGPLTRGDAWRRFLQMPGAWMLQGFAMFSVVEKASGLWVGQAGPWYPDGWPGTEVGYAFHPDAWGKGYATEACAAAMDWAFEVLGWIEVIHSIAPDNLASQAVARRLGSRLRGPGRLPAPLDSHPIEIWGQTREEWRARRVLGATRST
ncbi:GNAT family N-acetyltransferase [Vulcaniibacterium gelatinicum]|uniref:GNAT family N-acetyltransferase n=1 Tax=Vulcaniibacterium gelatinicum TaxID=2598725 RepID=UPI0011CA1833|nr:GNAT family N-acetyltransferase [Vulcaniibacterium gelatinicum]